MSKKRCETCKWWTHDFEGCKSMVGILGVCNDANYGKTYPAWWNESCDQYQPRDQKGASDEHE